MVRELENGQSSYPPDWVKQDFERFPRVQVASPGGVKTIEVLSPFSDASRDADARAYAALMRHVKVVDGDRHTVIMIQVENEIGVPDARDRSPAAAKAFAAAAPKELMDYLQQHKDSLIPELRQVWEAAGSKVAGTWQEVFGSGDATDEIFMGWSFARYVGRVVEMGKAEYPIPMYVNAWVPGFNKQHANPPCGSPMPDTIDVWRAGGPRIDMICPDIYDYDYAMMCAAIHAVAEPALHTRDSGLSTQRAGNAGALRLRTPRRDRFLAHGDRTSGRARHRVDQRLRRDPATRAPHFGTSRQRPNVRRVAGRGWSAAEGRVGRLHAGCRVFEAPALPGSPQPQPPFPNTAAIFIAVGPDEFYAAGNGVTVAFTPNTPGPPLAGLATVEEGTFIDGRWVPVRRLAGDDTATPRLVLPRLYVDEEHPALFGPSFKGIVRFTLYRYR